MMTNQAFGEVPQQVMINSYLIFLSTTIVYSSMRAKTRLYQN